MAIDKEFTIPAHPSIYKFHEREIKITLSYPEQGICGDTGILLLIPSYGENSSSESFVQARKQFADDHNLIVIMCDYFGLEFMQGVLAPNFLVDIDLIRDRLSPEDLDYIWDGKNIKLNRLLELGYKYNLRLEGEEVLNERLEGFNDMGLMQAIDNIAAVLATIVLLKENEYEFDRNKIMVYGVGHGAYLGYLCNAFAPALFTTLIDNSGWMLSPYLKRPRYLFGVTGGITYRIVINHMIKSLDVDEELLNLTSLYNKFHNRCHIVSFHGENDHFTNSTNKNDFCNSILSCTFTEIKARELSPPLIASANFGLDTDYISFFRYVYDNFKINNNKNFDNIILSHTIKTKKYEYQFDYSSGMPMVSRHQSSKS